MVPGLVRCCSSMVPVIVLADATWLDEVADGATLASPKSRILAWPRLVTKMFAGLMSRWTMPSEWAASRASAISMASASRVSFSKGRPAIHVLQRHAVEKFHRDEALALVLADFVDGADVGMVQRGSGAGFAAKTFESLRVLRNVVGKEFEGDKATEARCLRPCKQRPSRRRPVFRRCDSARWFGRSCGRAMVGGMVRQVNEAGMFHARSPSASLRAGSRRAGEYARSSG